MNIKLLQYPLEWHVKYQMRLKRFKIKNMNKRILLYVILILHLFIGCKKNGTKEAVIVLPTLSTEISEVTKNSAIFGSYIQSDGSTPITSQGFCFNTSPNPTISNNRVDVPLSNAINFSAKPTELKPMTKYYVKSFATNAVGTGYGPEKSFTTLPFAIGDKYGGGVIFYVDSSGIHGLVKASRPLTTYVWGCDGIDVTGTSTAFGSGQANTIAIINACGSANTAAKACADLVLEGYDDWFLPSKDELLSLCQWDRSNYTWCFWSSSQKDNKTSLLQCFENCGDNRNGYSKSYKEYVWPVRKF